MGTSPSSSPRVSGAAYATLAVLTAMNLLNYIDRYILAALLEPIGKELGLSDSNKGSLATSFYLSYTLFSPLVGLLGDRVPRKYLLAAGVGVWSLATVGAGVADSFTTMVLARSILGIGEAAYAILAPTLIADLFPRERRNMALTVFYVAIPVGAALGYGLGGAINSVLGWRAAFYFVGVPGFLAALAALFLREPARGATEEASEEQRSRYQALPLSWRAYTGLARNRSFVFNTLAMAMSTFALGGLQWWTPAFLERVRGMELERANFLLGVVVVLSGVIGTPAGGLLGQALARRFAGGYFWLCGVSMLLSVPFILLALFVPQPMAICILIFVGLTLALMNYGPSNAINVNVNAPRVRAAAIAVNLFVMHMLGDIPSPFLIGVVSDATGSLQHGLLLTIPALFLSGLFACAGARHYLAADQEAVVREVRGG